MGAVGRARHWAGRRVVVTGHTGFKGSWLSLWLRALGAEVTGLSIDVPTQPSLFESAGVGAGITDLRGDVNDLALVQDVIAEARPDVVLHLAAQPLVRRSYAEPVVTFATNVLGTAHVLEAVRRSPSVRTVVCVTTDKCYRNHETGVAYAEDDELGGHDPYSASKAAAELVAAAYRTSFLAGSEVAVATARAGNVIGGGDWADDRLVPDFARAARRGQPLEVRNPGAVRPWQHVLDCVDGYLLLAERLAEDPTLAGAWNFGPAAEDVRPVGWLVDELSRRWPEAPGWRHVGHDAAAPEAGLLLLDSDKARIRLGWRPALGLDAALDATVAWYRGDAAGDSATVTTEELDRRLEEAEVRP